MDSVATVRKVRSLCSVSPGRTTGMITFEPTTQIQSSKITAISGAFETRCSSRLVGKRSPPFVSLIVTRPESGFSTQPRGKTNRCVLVSVFNQSHLPPSASLPATWFWADTAVDRSGQEVGKSFNSVPWSCGARQRPPSGILATQIQDMTS